MVMQLKRLVHKSESTMSADEKASTSNDSDSNNAPTSVTTTGTGAQTKGSNCSTSSLEGLQYKYFWSTDYRNGAGGSLGNGNFCMFGRRFDQQEGECETTSRAASVGRPSSVTNGSTDEEDNRSIAERWHRPIRSCMPPQRLEAVDRDLERALQRVRYSEVLLITLSR